MKTLIFLMLAIVAPALVFAQAKDVHYIRKDLAPTPQPLDPTTPCKAWYEKLDGTKINSQAFSTAFIICEESAKQWSTKNAKIIRCPDSNTGFYEFHYQWPDFSKQKTVNYICSGNCSGNTSISCSEDK